MSDDSFADSRVPKAAAEGAVFAPFRLRFRPFIDGRDSREMLLRRAFGASALVSADKKRRKRSKRASEQGRSCSQ
jgi:hypothetical protein